MDKIFEITPFLGFYHEECKKFVDKNIFEVQFHNYIRLIKVKIWYGTYFNFYYKFCIGLLFK